MSNILRYMHNKFLTYFRKYTSSDSHFILMMSCDVTGGGPMEAPIVELSVISLLLSKICLYQKKNLLLFGLQFDDNMMTISIILCSVLAAVFL